MAEARRVIPDIDFNGKSAKKSLDGLTEQIEYDDVASGASDTLSIQVFNKDMKFLKAGCRKRETGSRPASPLRIGPKREQTKSYHAETFSWMR